MAGTKKQTKKTEAPAPKKPSKGGVNSSPAAEKLRQAALKEIAGRIGASDPTGAEAAADRENAKKAKERSASKDNMTSSERAMLQTTAESVGLDPLKAPSPLKAVGETKMVVSSAGKSAMRDSKRKPDVTDRAIAEADGPGPGKLSMLDAAVVAMRDLGEKDSYDCKALIAEMSARKLWTSPNGKTPHSTLYAAMTGEIKKKGGESRFIKFDRGRFALSAAGRKP